MVIAPLTGMPIVMVAATVPLLAFGSISVPERSLMRSEAKISAAAGTGQSTLNFTRDGDGFGAMSGTSKVKSEMLILRPAGVSAIPCPIVTVEDHWPEGGLGEAVLSALGDADERPPVVRLAVHEMPHSGKPAELLAEAGIDADGIAAAARTLARAGASAS